MNERKVLQWARWAVGGIENAIDDGLEPDGKDTFNGMLAYIKDTVMGECERECRFLGRERIENLCIIAIFEHLRDGYHLADFAL